MSCWRRQEAQPPRARWASKARCMEASSVMRVTSEVLISFFESKRAALQGLALIEPTGDRRRPRSPAVVVSREADGSRSPFEPPAASPLGAVIGASLGAVLGSFGGEAGLIVGLFFGLYAGAFVDLWRTLARADLLDEVQDGLAPGQAALVTFIGGSSAAIEHRLAATDAVTVHRFPGNPIEDDFGREVREATAELGRLVAARDAAEGGLVDRERAIAAARRKLSVLESIASRLLWLERLQSEFEAGILKRELRGSPRWRAGCLRHRARHLRASHQHSRTMLEASSARVRGAEAQAEAMGVEAARGQAAAV